jgi:hypothetical protein
MSIQIEAFLEMKMQQKRIMIADLSAHARDNGGSGV